MNKRSTVLIVALLGLATNTFAQIVSETAVSIKFGGSNPAASWIANTKPLLLGYGEGANANAIVNIMSASNNDSSARGYYGLKRSRGTLASPALVKNNDLLGSVLASGFDGKAFQNGASIDFMVDGTATTGAMPSKISLATGTNNNNRTERLRISSSGDFIFNNNQLYLQRSRGRLGIGTLNPSYQLHLSKDEAAKPSTSTWTITSDERLKNIDGNYKKGLADIIKLKPVTYHYKNSNTRTFEEKTLKSPAFGFTAQEVQKVFPEAVGEDEDGYLNFNIHPILIASINAFKDVKAELDKKDKIIANMQEQLNTQQAAIDLILNKLALLESRSTTTGTPSNQNITLSTSDLNTLAQNAPNPIRNTTVIKYHLTPSAKTAYMQITDAKGSVIRAISLTPASNGQVTLSAGSLATGTYYYTLYVDGQKIDTKQMQIIR